MTTRMRKYGMLLIAAVLLVALAFSGAGAAAEVEAGTFDALVAAIDAGSDVKLTNTIEITETKELDLKGHTVKAGFSDKRMFLVKSGATFTLKDTSSAKSGKIDGQAVGQYQGIVDGPVVYIENGAKFIMNGVTMDGAHFGNNGGIVYVAGTFEMNGGTLEKGHSAHSGGGGGAVYLAEGSSFTMKDGTIKDCAAYYYGGAVYLAKNSKFTMEGGTITNCEADDYHGGAIYISGGNFTMNGGSITNCCAERGGAVDLESGTFTMDNGATISDCKTKSQDQHTEYGGGVYINSGTATINKGSILRCTTEDRGGGVALIHGLLVMNDNALISQCTSTTDYGGGVYIEKADAEPYPVFRMNGGTISSCTAQDYGGGVYINSHGSTIPVSLFEMNGGTISDCSVISTWGEQDEGGGVYLEGMGANFVMNGGLITGCYAEDYGGGVFVDDGSEFTMNGGVITNCRVDDDGGAGVWVDRDDMVESMKFSGTPVVYNNYKGDSQNNVHLDTGLLIKGMVYLVGDFHGIVGISGGADEFGMEIIGSYGRDNFIKDNTNQKSHGSSSTNYIKWGTEIPEFKDINADVIGLVKATQPVTDSSKIYTVGRTITLMNPLVIAGGTPEQPVTINIKNTESIFGSQLYHEPVITVNEGCHLKLTGGGRICEGYGENGGIIYLKKGSSLTVEDGIRISGGHSRNGGGIYADENTFVQIADGHIESNNAEWNGGGIYSKGVSVSMLGGDIKKNTAKEKGSGMYVSAQTIFNVGNLATVADNGKGDKKDNVYLESDNAVNLFGSLNGKIGISYAGATPELGDKFGVALSFMSSGAENIVADGKNLEGKISGRDLVWSELRNSTTVTFNANGGKVSPSSKKVFEGEPYGILPIPVRASYAFAGWYPNAKDPWGTEITKDTLVPADLGPTKTLYAKWSGPIVTVTFDANGGSVSPSSKQVVKGEKYGELPIPLRDGYSFAGWFADKQCTPGMEVTQDTLVPENLVSPQTLYAKWKEGPVNVTLDTNGGKALDPITVYPGKPYGNLPIPEPSVTGYTFVGWYLTPDFSGAKITKDTIVKTITDHDLYAKWFGPIIVSNTNIDFGTVFKGDPIPTLTDMVYTDLDGTVTLTFPSGDFGFSKSDTGKELSGIVTIPKNTQYSFTITPSSTATEGFYSADIPITKGETLLGNLSVTMSVVAKDLETDKKVSYPDLPTVYNLIDANKSNVAWIVGVEDGDHNLKVDGEGTATISYDSRNAADNFYLRITSVTSKPAGIDNAIMLSAQSRITAHYSSKNLENKYRNPAGTYSVELGLTDVLRNLPTFTGTFNESLTRMITAMKYTPVVMVSPVNGKDALDTMNPLVEDKGVEVTFTVPVSQLPESIVLTGEVTVFSVDADGDVLVAITPDSARQVGDEYVITAHGSSLSSYVLAFDKGWEYYGITPLESPHGVIYPDYLFSRPNHFVYVTPVPEDGYQYWGMFVFNESGSLYTVTTGTSFRMLNEHVYLYGLFAKETPLIRTVSFNMMGHGDQIPPQDVKYGETAKQPPDPTASGYAFEGWFSDSTLTIPYNFDKPVMTDLTLYAKWTAVSHRGHSASLPTDYTPSDYVEPMDQDTSTPTTTPTLAAPTMMPITTPTQTQKSPAPFVGLIAGLGVAALVLTRMRR